MHMERLDKVYSNGVEPVRFRQAGSAPGLNSRTGPFQATKCGSSPLTLRARGQRERLNATNTDSFNVPGADINQSQSMTCYDKFLIVQPQGERLLCRQSPFLIEKLFRDVASIKHLKSGDYLIETVSDDQSKHYLQKQRVGNFPVKVTPHTGLNTIKGVIESDGLKTADEEEMIQGLAHYGVIDCFFYRKKQPNGAQTKTGRVILTFKGQTFPIKSR